MKSSILYLHSLGVRPKVIVRPSGHSLIQDSLSRLGHISLKHVKNLHDDGLLTSSDFGSFETCESCLLGKMTKSPFAKSCERASELLELIHSDVCGPMSTTARGGYQYFVTFTDDLS